MDDTERANGSAGHEQPENGNVAASQRSGDGLGDGLRTDPAGLGSDASADGASAVRKDLPGPKSCSASGNERGQQISSTQPAPAAEAGQTSSSAASAPAVQPSVTAMEPVSRPARSLLSVRQESTDSAAVQAADAMPSAVQQGESRTAPPGRGTANEAGAIPDSNTAKDDLANSVKAPGVKRTASAPSLQTSSLQRFFRRSTKTTAEQSGGSDVGRRNAGDAQEGSGGPLLPGAQLSLSGASLQDDATCAVDPAMLCTRINALALSTCAG